MRNISAASLAKLSQKTGTEPLTIIEVQWNADGNYYTYGDKQSPGVDGRIINVSTFDDVVNLSITGTSQAITFVLSDHDGHLKNVFDTCDIQKRKVWVYQWFTGLPLSEKILIFVGEIESPVAWNEGDRTLTFTVASQADGGEVGFSPEQGTFPGLPDNLVGRAWPLIFGRPLKSTTICIDDIVTSSSSKNGYTTPVLKTSLGLRDPSLALQLKDIAEKQANLRNFVAPVNFLAALAEFSIFQEQTDFDFTEDQHTSKNPHAQAGVKYEKAGNDALLQAAKLGADAQKLVAVKEAQIKEEKQNVEVAGGNNYPQNTPLNMNIGGAIYSGYFSGETFNITSGTHPSANLYSDMQILPVQQRNGNPLIVRSDFFFADAGTPVRIGAAQGLSAKDDNLILPVRYVVAATLQVQVLNAYARRTINDTEATYAIPTNYYQVIQVSFGTLPVTLLYLPQPLSSIEDGGKWSDEIWVDVVSPIGPNICGILEWLISTYTKETWNYLQFIEVSYYLIGDPANFALTSQPNVIELMKDIAYQARCLLDIRNGEYGITYLPFRGAPTNTITEADIIEQTLIVNYTDSHDLVTKYTAEWKFQGADDKANLIVLRFNIARYGTIEKKVDYFCFNQQQIVYRSAVFWMIRTSNTYKRIVCTVPITKLNIETLDIVTVNFTHKFIANGPVDCMVESAVLDTENYTIQLTIWCPVRAGEMTEYLFGFPAGLNVETDFPTQQDIAQNRTSSSSSANTGAKLPSNPKVSKPFGGTSTGGIPISYGEPLTNGRNTGYGNNNPPAPDVQPFVTGGFTNGSGVKPPGTTKYAYTQPKDTTVVIADPVNMVIPGFIVETGDDNTKYNVNVYFSGLDNKATLLKNVRILQISKGDPEESEDPPEIPKDTAVIVVQVVWKDEEDKFKIEQYIQPPVWL